MYILGIVPRTRPVMIALDTRSCVWSSPWYSWLAAECYTGPGPWFIPMAPRPWSLLLDMTTMAGEAWPLDRTSNVDKERHSFPVPLHTGSWLYMSFWIISWIYSRYHTISLSYKTSHSAKHTSGMKKVQVMCNLRFSPDLYCVAYLAL